MDDVLVIEGYESLMDSLSSIQTQVMRLESNPGGEQQRKAKLFDILHDLQVVMDYIVEQK